MENAKAQPSEWLKYITQWSHSGLSQKAFCDKHQLNYGNFKYWRQKFQADVAKKSSGFVPIVVQHDIRQHEIQLELRGGHRVNWRVSGFTELATQLREMDLL
jgi:hypothetical protein